MSVCPDVCLPSTTSGAFTSPQDLGEVIECPRPLPLPAATRHTAPPRPPPGCFSLPSQAQRLQEGQESSAQWASRSGTRSPHLRRTGTQQALGARPGSQPRARSLQVSVGARVTEADPALLALPGRAVDGLCSSWLPWRFGLG